MSERSEPRDKLDATAEQAVVNGPEDDSHAWYSISWRQVEKDVRRLRQRIFAATQKGDLATVRNLQKLMLRSHANTLVSVRRVTEINPGRVTGGIDGKIVITAADRTRLSKQIDRQRDTWRPLPVRRVYIPKANGKRRPLGIPVIIDRAHQARVLNALEPEWEARFEARSYGFRPGRGCHDAISAIFASLAGKNAKRLWILDADLTSAFDRIAHHHLVSSLGTFPATGLIRDWLRAGVVECGLFTPTEQGTPQGGVISPLLLNVALHGMEEAVGSQRGRGPQNSWAVRGTPTLVRYADDFVVLCHSHNEAHQVRQRVKEWLANRGLTLNAEKTQIVTAQTGFDFLGFNVRRYGDKLLIMPSKSAVKRIRARLSDEVRTLRGANSEAVVGKLNPIIRGWANYYRTVVSSATFNSLDYHMWQIIYRWAKFRHRRKSKDWIVNRYFRMPMTHRNDRWVFHDRDTGRFLVKFAWTKIVRHQMVQGSASLDDPALTEYWAGKRRRRQPPLMDQRSLRLLKAQHGRCPICRCLLLYSDQQPQTPSDWEQWFKVTRKAAIGGHLAGLSPGNNTGPQVLAHASCLRRHQLARRKAANADTF